MKILYGIVGSSIDVTHICKEKLTVNNIITIPNGDINRSTYFSDPLPRIVKSIFIEHNGKTLQYDPHTQIKINIIDNIITTNSNKDINMKIETIHSKLKLKYGSLKDELPEQKMVVRYLTGNEKVLEIGGNIGRNSLVIASILKHNKFVTLESSLSISKQLQENRDINNLDFYIENSALSKRKLIQKGWDTIPCDTLRNGYTFVNTITLDQLQRKYNIAFDTLILDCEGAFYYILMDMPEILNNINLIIMENDYKDINHKNYIDNVLCKNNFNRDYVESGGWGVCYKNFFEVWKRDI